MKSWNGDSWRDKDVMVMSSSATVSVFATYPPIDRPVLTIQYKYKYTNTNTNTQIQIQIHSVCVCNLSTDWSSRANRWIQYRYNKDTVQIYNRQTIKIWYKYNTNVVQTLYQYSTNTTQICICNLFIDWLPLPNRWAFVTAFVILSLHLYLHAIG